MIVYTNTKVHTRIYFIALNYKIEYFPSKIGCF